LVNGGRYGQKEIANAYSSNVLLAGL